MDGQELIYACEYFIFFVNPRKFFLFGAAELMELHHANDGRGFVRDNEKEPFPEAPLLCISTGYSRMSFFQFPWLRDSVRSLLVTYPITYLATKVPGLESIFDDRSLPYAHFMASMYLSLDCELRKSVCAWKMTHENYIRPCDQQVHVLWRNDQGDLW